MVQLRVEMLATLKKLWKFYTLFSLIYDRIKTDVYESCISIEKVAISA